MQDLTYGIWKNDKAKRKAIWEDVMKETLDFFERMTELGYEDRIGQQDMSYDIIESIRDNQDIIVEASVGIGFSKRTYECLFTRNDYKTKTRSWKIN